MTLSKIEVDGQAMLVSNFKLSINMLDLDGQSIALKIPEDHPPLTAFEPKLTEQQILGLWLIAEGIVIPGKNARPGWWLAETLRMPRSNISSRVTKPLEKMDLICYEYRPTTRQESAHPNKEEKAWCLKRASMKVTFDVLFSVFFRRDFNNLLWPGKEERKATAANINANNRCLSLAYLQKRIREYENSEQYYLDLGVKPPADLSSKAIQEKAPPGRAASISFRGVGPLRFVDETLGDRFPSSEEDGPK